MTSRPQFEPGAVELLLGSEMGRWVVGHVNPAEVARIVTLDDEIARVAARRRIAVTGRPEGSVNALSVHYPRVLDESELNRYGRIYNLHPGYLPWGRGHFPLVWALWLSEPAGATLHRMVARLDAGPIIDQVSVAVHPDDSAHQLYLRICDAERALWGRWWSVLAGGADIPERIQEEGGSYHSKREFEQLRATSPSELSPVDLDRLRRAIEFPGRPGLNTDRVAASIVDRDS